MNRISGVLFYSLILIYLKAFLHNSSCAKDLEKGLHFLYVHCIQLFSRNLYTALKMFTQMEIRPQNLEQKLAEVLTEAVFRQTSVHSVPCWYALLLR